MNTAFADFLNGIAQSGPIGTIVQIGAGDVPAALATGAGAIVVALPKPLVADALRGLADRDDRLTLRPAAIGLTAGTARLQMFNFAALSSLSAPSPELQALFPGLAVTGQPEVEVMALDRLLLDLPEDPERQDVLILDMPGSEAVLIGALTARAGAPRFGHVLLRAGAAPLYAGTRSFPDLATMLEEGGLRIVTRDTRDPDLPVAHFRLDPLTLRVRELQSALEAEKTARKAADAEAGAQADARAALQAEREICKAERDKAHADEVRRLREDIAALEAEASRRERGEAGMEPDGRGTSGAEARAQIQDLTATLSDPSARQARAAEQALNETLRTEFRRIEAQMEILRDFIAARSPGSPASEGAAPVAAPAAKTR